MDVKQVYMSYVGRRRGLIKALTTESDLLFARCDPDIEEPLFVFGLPDENWDIASPTNEVLPRDFPKPKSGINFRRDTDDLWLNTVALQCDLWLHSVESHLAATSDFDEANRKRFLRMTRKLLPLYELLIWEAKKGTVPKISAMSKNIMSQADILSEESSSGQPTTDDGASTAQSRAGQPSESA